MKEGLDSFIARVQDQYPEIDTKPKLLKYMPFYIKTKTFGWSTQCCCIKHSNFDSSLNYINRLSKHIKGESFPELKYTNFEENFACLEAKQEDKNRILKMYRCFTKWESDHCFLHKKSKSTCIGKCIGS